MTSQQAGPPFESRDADFIAIIDDDENVATLPQESWPILVVDDDEEVHHATEYALKGLRILNRPLTITHAYSAAGAGRILAETDQFAAILLDVVMETSDAGLRLVDHIRNTLRLTEPRIILRTGQPGYAPEIQVFEHYDINDYRTKSELTQTRLVTSLMAAIRSYRQIRMINENRRGLEMIVSAAANLIELRSIQTFAEGVLIQIAALLDVPVDGVVCVQRRPGLPSESAEALYIVGAAGPFAKYLSQPLSTLDDEELRTTILATLARRSHLFESRRTILYLHNDHGEGAIYLRPQRPLSSADRSLIEVFTTNIATCFGNVRLVEELNHLAYHDRLTGLFNHGGFIRVLDTPQDAAASSTAVALIDLKQFHDINDGLGRTFGDALLKAIALRLRESLPDTCHLGRIDGDVFAVAGPETVVNPDTLEALFRTPVSCEGHTLPITAVLGFCRIHLPGVDGGTLLSRANIALNLAKLNGRAHYAYFAPALEDDLRNRLSIIGSLHQAFEDQGLAVWFQPQVDLRTSQVWGMEALARWPKGEGFAHPPSVFIPLAESSGLIVAIGYWVLDQACRAFTQIGGHPNAPPRFAVNASIAQFRSPDFVGRVAGILSDHGLKPHHLELEITENLAMDDPTQVLSILCELNRLGVRVALDDFGTGYSSLSRLDRMPIGTLKIDQAFVRQIGNGSGADLAETIAALGRKLKVTTVAEGIETADQLSRLQAYECDVGQGYLFAKPMEEAALRVWLDTAGPSATEATKG